jgi:hypothetical protein
MSTFYVRLSSESHGLKLTFPYSNRIFSYTPSRWGIIYATVLMKE